jgi:hypothetical protein
MGTAHTQLPATRCAGQTRRPMTLLTLSTGPRPMLRTVTAAVVVVITVSSRHKRSSGGELGGALETARSRTREFLAGR